VQLIWSCTPGPLIRGGFGGYADRLKGIVTGALLASKLGRDFAIEWDGLTRIQDYFDCDCCVSDTDSSSSTQVLAAIDRLVSEQDVARLLEEASASKADRLYLTANQFAAEHCRVLGGEATPEATFASVISSLLKPNEALLSDDDCHEYAALVRSLPAVGLQIRTNDRGWDGRVVWKVPSIEDALLAVEPAGAVFVSSDSSAWKYRFRGACKSKRVLSTDFVPAHLDRSPGDEVRNGFRAIVVEHYVLSQCARVFIGQGGFGLTAAWWGRKPCVELPAA
jgi:hypothetical protein